MSYPHSNGGGGGTADNGSHRGYSGDEHESRSGGEEGGGSVGRNDDSDIILHDKPTYLLEHLATFTVNKDSGIVYPADGMRRLLQLEKTTGIWSQKMQLCLDYHWVLIMDYETGNIIERFPASLIQEPTAFTSMDAMELYNNILVFIVSGGSGSRSEMHIFQSQSVSAVHLVEDLKNLQRGNFDLQQREVVVSQAHTRQTQQHTLPHNSNNYPQIYMDSNSNSGGVSGHIKAVHSPGAEHHGNYQQRSLSKEQHAYSIQNENDNIATGLGEIDSDHGGAVDSRVLGGGGGFGGVNLNDETSSVSSDKYERDVNVLNHCFDDIEKFIARLQHAAAASRELERRRRNRKSKKKDPGEGLLTLRTRPPHEKEFIDIFAKFKLSFNLLAKLKAHIHDPNAPELVHFLFTPLALIVEAASDTYYESQLPTRVVNPLLTREAVNLLINCVTSKETELWRSLGDAWTVPRDQWKDDVGSYHPVFLDGWSPDYLIIDELEKPTAMTPPPPAIISCIKKHTDNGRDMSVDITGNSSTGLHDSTVLSYDVCDDSDKYNFENSTDAIDRYSEVVMPYSDNQQSNKGHVNVATTTIGNADDGVAIGVQAITTGVQNLYSRGMRHSNHGNMIDQADSSFSVAVSHAVSEMSGNVRSGDDQMVEQWLEDLQAAGAKIVLVTYPRTANNDKELSVVRGEYLEILDDSRKWWKARNIRGQMAHVPHTIVTPFSYGDMETIRNQNVYTGHQQPSHYSKARNSNSGENSDSRTSSNDNADWVRNKHLVIYSKPSATATEMKVASNTPPNYGCTVQDELKQVLRQRERIHGVGIRKMVTAYIHQKSSAAEVYAWLKAKEFSPKVIERLKGLNAEALFALSREGIMDICDTNEGKRLASQLSLQKSLSGYKTARSSELHSFLAKARPKSEINMTT